MKLYKWIDNTGLIYKRFGFDIELGDFPLGNYKPSRTYISITFYFWNVCAVLGVEWLKKKPNRIKVNKNER